MLFGRAEKDPLEDLDKMGFFSKFFVSILAVIIMSMSAAVSIAAFMPFMGALVRLRANYNPKAVGFAGTENTVGPRLTGLWGTLKRTKRLEGWYGLYKGAIASFAHVVLISTFTIIFIGAAGYKNVAERKASFGLFLLPFVTAAIALPMAILENRAIITPYRLPNNLRGSLDILLSNHERARPLSLYATPGLLPAVFIRGLLHLLVVRGMHAAIMGGEKIAKAAAWRTILYLFFLALSTLWITPLDVIITKLSVQPNLGGEVAVSSADEIDEATPEGLRFAGTDEDVIGLRPTTEAYTSLVDAAQKINDEEGWQTFYRGWWWTALAAVGPFLATGH
ncbi:hypothetical protein Q8F55_004819 [Vanrija albida]|uniref:Mitochondrial carrier n=1 Tax=Vanrija albida TaxID=181172 RepID=A0ABR3Q0P0_9TREE